MVLLAASAVPAPLLPLRLRLPLLAPVACTLPLLLHALPPPCLLLLLAWEVLLAVLAVLAVLRCCLRRHCWAVHDHGGLAWGQRRLQLHRRA
jgi:hypothetical protein